jgi:hypothetical protein
MDPKTRDLTLHFGGHGLTYVAKSSSAMVTATVTDNTLSVSLDKMILHTAEPVVTITATDSRGTMLENTVAVRRNRMPVAGEMVAVAATATAGTGTDTDPLWVGTQAGKNTRDVMLTIGSRDCEQVEAGGTGECHFADDDELTFMVGVSGNEATYVSGMHKAKGTVSIKGLKSTGANDAVMLDVRAKDSGDLFSEYAVDLIAVKVNGAPMPMKDTFLPALAFGFNAMEESIDADTAKGVFMDEDADNLDTHTIEMKSSDPKVASVTTGMAGPWLVTPIGPGTATITVTLTEPLPDEGDGMNGMGQTATQTFTVVVRDR